MGSEQKSRKSIVNEMSMTVPTHILFEPGQSKDGHQITKTLQIHFSSTIECKQNEQSK
jgi:hypothetical protein